MFLVRSPSLSLKVAARAQGLEARLIAVVIGGLGFPKVTHGSRDWSSHLRVTAFGSPSGSIRQYLMEHIITSDITRILE